MRVFVSYHAPDRKLALDLKAAIEKAVPAAHLFVDQEGLRHGQLWQPALFEEISNSQAFLILVSTQLGDWQKVEYYEARDRKAKDDNFVLLPIIIADKTRGPAANLPGLAQLHWIESTEPTAPEPLEKIATALTHKAIAPSPKPWATFNPYRGLSALQEQDTDFFFGRDSETGSVLNAIANKPGRLIALVGNSGVGKSSLVQAGVIGALKRQRWPGGLQSWPEALKDSRAWAFLTMKPGDDAIAALASSFASLWFLEATDPARISNRNRYAEMLRKNEARLADLLETTEKRFANELALVPPKRLFLYIDQGEELYTRPSDELKRFSDIIAAGLSDPRLVVIMSQRADYYGRLQANHALFPSTEKIDVAPLALEAMKVVLYEPAKVLGVSFESNKSPTLIAASAAEQPGALPLVSDYMTDLWIRMQRRGDGVLRTIEQTKILQFGEMLANRADEFIKQNPHLVGDLRRLFTLKLTLIQREGDPIRTRLELGNNCSPKELDLIRLLSGPDWRMVVTSEDGRTAYAEVAHDVLLREWETLRRWLEQERNFLIWLGETRRDEKRWDEAPRDQKDDSILMGIRLREARRWLETRPNDIDSKIRKYITESVRVVERDYTRGTISAGIKSVIIPAVILVAGLVVFNFSQSREILISLPIIDYLDTVLTRAFGEGKLIAVSVTAIAITLGFLYLVGVILDKYLLVAKGAKYGDVENNSRLQATRHTH